MILFLPCTSKYYLRASEKSEIKIIDGPPGSFKPDGFNWSFVYQRCYFPKINENKICKSGLKPSSNIESVQWFWIKFYKRKTKYGYADVRSTIENINGQKYKDIVLFSYKFDCTNNFYKGKTTWDDDGFVVNSKWSSYERGSAMDMYAKQACN